MPGIGFIVPGTNCNKSLSAGSAVQLGDKYFLCQVLLDLQGDSGSGSFAAHFSAVLFALLSLSQRLLVNGEKKILFQGKADIIVCISNSRKRLFL